NFYFGIMRDEGLPVFLLRVGHRGGDDAEVIRRLFRADIELPLVMLDAVFVTFFARQNDFERAARLIGRQIARLVRGLGVGRHDYHLPVIRAGGADVEEFVFLLIKHLVFVAADDVTPELVVALGNRVFRDVKERLVVGGPDDGGRALDLFVRQLPVAQVFD